MTAPRFWTSASETAKGVMAILAVAAIAMAAGAMGFSQRLDLNEQRDSARDDRIGQVERRVGEIEQLGSRLDRMLCYAEEDEKERQGIPVNRVRCAR